MFFITILSYHKKTILILIRTDHTKVPRIDVLFPPTEPSSRIAFSLEPDSHQHMLAEDGLPYPIALSESPYRT